MQNILFFDDDSFATNYLIQNLKDNYGWKGDKEITFVSTSDELLNEIIKNADSYDLFVLDVIAGIPSNTPNNFFSAKDRNKMADGYSLGLVMAEKIRKVKKNVPILYLSGGLTLPIPDSERGFTTFIKKPVSPEELSKEMNRLLGI